MRDQAANWPTTATGQSYTRPAPPSRVIMPDRSPQHPKASTSRLVGLGRSPVSTTGLDPYYRSYLCRSRGRTVSQETVRADPSVVGWSGPKERMLAGVRQVPQFRGWPAADGAVFGESADIDSLVLALTGFDESETGWTLFRCCRPASPMSNNGWEMTRRVGAPFLLLDIGDVGLVHGIEHIDRSASCV